MPENVQLYVTEKTGVAAFRYRDSQTELSAFSAGGPISDGGTSASLLCGTRKVATPAGALLVRSFCGCKDERFRGVHLRAR